MSLVTYRAKRDFQKTREPRGNVRSLPRPRSQILYVIQKHAASHLHYDFRLEMGGVLKSWAVPKGIPTTKGDKRLAMAVEDHPVEYASFEGTIPAGNYGAGTVMLWDAGIAEVLDEIPSAAFERGKLNLKLQGQKLNGHWALVRMRPDARGKVPWLLIKTEADMKPLSARADDRSVKTGRNMQQISLKADETWQSNRQKNERRNSKTVRQKTTRPTPRSHEPDARSGVRSRSRSRSRSNVSR